MKNDKILEEKIVKLENLCITDLEGPETNPGGSWFQLLDTEKVEQWCRSITNILMSINNSYYVEFNNATTKISKEWHYGDKILRQNVQEAKKCLSELLNKIKQKTD